MSSDPKYSASLGVRCGWSSVGEGGASCRVLKSPTVGPNLTFLGFGWAPGSAVDLRAALGLEGTSFGPGEGAVVLLRTSVLTLLLLPVARSLDLVL